LKNVSLNHVIYLYAQSIFMCI